MMINIILPTPVKLKLINLMLVMYLVLHIKLFCKFIMRVENEII